MTYLRNDLGLPISSIYSKYSFPCDIQLSNRICACVEFDTYCIFIKYVLCGTHNKRTKSHFKSPQNISSDLGYAGKGALLDLGIHLVFNQNSRAKNLVNNRALLSVADNSIPVIRREQPPNEISPPDLNRTLTLACTCQSFHITLISLVCDVHYSYIAGSIHQLGAQLYRVRLDKHQNDAEIQYSTHSTQSIHNQNKVLEVSIPQLPTASTPSPALPAAPGNHQTAHPPRARRKPAQHSPAIDSTGYRTHNNLHLTAVRRSSIPCSNTTQQCGSQSTRLRPPREAERPSIQRSIGDARVQRLSTGICTCAAQLQRHPGKRPSSR